MQGFHVSQARQQKGFWENLIDLLHPGCVFVSFQRRHVFHGGRRWLVRGQVILVDA